MSGLYSALLSMAFSSVAWFAKGGAIVGALLGGVLAYLPISRVLRAQGAAPQRVAVRRTAGVCCLVWGLVLPPVFGTAGLLWGLAHGLGNVVEGPVSTTVRATVETWMSRASGLRSGVLARYPLAKRLSEGELAQVVRATPELVSDVLGHTEAAAIQQQASEAVTIQQQTQTGAALIPPQVTMFLREEFESLAAGRRHRAWLAPTIERLRARARGAAGDWPTLQETVTAMVAPPVFDGAAASIRARAWRYIWRMILVALLLSGALAGALRALWRLPGAAAPTAAAPAPSRPPAPTPDENPIEVPSGEESDG
jgi:hypothetical protein